MPTKSTARSKSGSATDAAKSSKLRLKRILVPLDFSGESRRALDYAIPLAEKFGARIALVHVVAPIPLPIVPPAFGTTYTTIPVRGLRKQAASTLHERGQKLIPRALYERSIVSVGHAASEIVAIAERIDADMIVLTTHGHSGIHRFLMGSTAEQVVRHAKCPVISVRRK
jgi:nucleotide-binding universal stress UspA family protein